MLRILALLIFLSLASSNWSETFTQSWCTLKHDHVWVMGGIDIDTVTDRYGGNEINFNDSPASTNTNYKPIRSPYQNCSFSSADGDLLFYSNGCEVYGSNDEILVGGNKLNPGTKYNEFCPEYGYGGIQGMLVLTDPLNKSLMRIFHIDQKYDPENHLPKLVHPEHVYVTTVRWNDTLQVAEVIAKNVTVLEDTSIFAYAMTAVRHANGQDWWIVLPTTWSMTYKVLLVTAEGITFHSSQYLADTDSPLAEGGQAKFSPDGRQYAIYYPKVIYNDRNILMLYQFDRETGLLSDPLDIPIPFSDFITGGVEFSPSGQFLYYNTDTSLFQMDTWAEDIPASLTHIADYDGFGDPLPTRFFLQERTPDHRIIMNVTNGSKFLHVIKEPDKKGTDCRFEQHAIELPTVNNFTLPHFPNYRLGALEEPPCDTTVYLVEPEPEHPSIQISPNPARDYITIETNLPWNWIKVTNATGVDIGNVYPGNDIPGVTFEIDNLPAGLYFAIVGFIDGKIMSKAFVVL